ncbi:MAG TPA: hypothetical protein VGC32_16460 [Solirubrobacterales bacterium]
MPTPIDDITVLKEFNEEREAEPPEARAAIWAAMEARMDAAASEARAFGEAVAGSAPPAPPRGGRRFLSGGRREPSRRRRLGLAFAGAAFAAAVVAGTLVLSSGPTAQPASAAEILHQAADAAAELPATSVPGPGQYLYRKERMIGVQSWRSPLPPLSSDLPSGIAGATMHGPHAYNALMPTTTESWTDGEGGGRRRLELGALQFWSKAEEAHWKAAGSPLPAPFSAEYQHRYRKTQFEDALEANSKVVDTETEGYGKSFHFPDTSKLPTAPKALRRAAEANQLEYTGFNHTGGQKAHLDAGGAKEELLNVLQEGFPTPRLQAAIFDALAELPGIKVETGVTDGLGREGDAIRATVGRGLPTAHGLRSDYIFSPETGELLADRVVLVHPERAESFYRELPAGTVVYERDYIAEATVDSTKATGQGGGAG